MKRFATSPIFFLIKMTQCWWLWLNWTENVAVVVGVQPVMMIIYRYISEADVFKANPCWKCSESNRKNLSTWKRAINRRLKTDMESKKMERTSRESKKGKRNCILPLILLIYLWTYYALCKLFLYQSPEKKHVVLSSSHHHHQPASRQLHGKLGEELVRSSKWKGWIHHILIVIQPYTQAISTMSCRYWSSLSAIFSWRVDHHRYRHTYFCAVCVDTPIQVYYYFQIEIEMENHHVVFVACPFYSRSDNLLFCPYKIYSTTFILFHFPFHLV